MRNSSPLKAALFEVDKAKLPGRIEQAETALALRARELFHVAGDNIEEGEALDDAMYALHALQNTSQTTAVWRIAVRRPRSTHKL